MTLASPPPPPPSVSTLFAVILALACVAWAWQGGEFAPVMDCDETFNYVEAAHYSLHGTGMQTWEYAPQYGLRSWFYIELHLLPVRVAKLVVQLTRPQELLLLRAMLVVLSCWCEAQLAHAVGLTFGASSWLTALLLGLSPGMGHARRSFLPSSTCMMCFTLAQAMWMRGRPRLALVVGSFAVLVCWPFSALPYVPIGLQVLLTTSGGEGGGGSYGGVVAIAQIVLGALVVFGALPAAVDSWYYGKPAWPALRMVLYNALGASGGGAHLYGTEPWTFYFKNLALNFNVALPASLLAAATATRREMHVYLVLPGVLAFGVFQLMAHKEERFLFALYPSVCWSAAVWVGAAQSRGSSWRRALLWAFSLAFVAASASRHLALGRLTASNQVYPLLIEHHQQQHGNGAALCLGREWYRFPSSFYLPPSVALKWTRSDFAGILPQPFEGYSREVPHMNDLNREEPTRYVAKEEDECAYVVDVDQPYGPRDQLRPFAQPAEWERVGCLPFAQTDKAKQPFRSFVLPVGEGGVPWADYCLFARRTRSNVVV